MRIFPDVEPLSAAAAELIAGAARREIARRGRFTVALSGGATPRRTYELLADQYGGQILWGRVELFLGDERWVPPGDPESNFAMLRDTLVSRVPIPSERVHPIRTVGVTPEESSHEYESLLRNTFADADVAEPRTFDLTLLGVGADGHTASLFPGSAALEERVRWVRPVESPGARTPLRITLTLPVISASRRILVLCAGASKRAVAEAILGGAPTALEYPAARVSGAEETTWFLDRAAAGALAS